MPMPAVPDAAVDPARTLEMTRRFAAPREAVFAAWTDPAQLARWLGPSNIEAEVLVLDARPGGAYRIAVHGGPLGVNVVYGVYREVVRPERLVFTWGWEKSIQDGSERWESLVTVTLRSLDRHTEMTLRHERLANAEMREGHNRGWTSSFDKLADLLAAS